MILQLWRRDNKQQYNKKIESHRLFDFHIHLLFSMWGFIFVCCEFILIILPVVILLEQI